jgi:hypothetical protein
MSRIARAIRRHVGVDEPYRRFPESIARFSATLAASAP